MQRAEEVKLIRKAQGGSEYFGEIYEKHFDRIFNYVFRRVADFHLARDITSENHHSNGTKIQGGAGT